MNKRRKSLKLCKKVKGKAPILAELHCNFADFIRSRRDGPTDCSKILLRNIFITYRLIMRVSGIFKVPRALNGIYNLCSIIVSIMTCNDRLIEVNMWASGNTGQTQSKTCRLDWYSGDGSGRLQSNLLLSQNFSCRRAHWAESVEICEKMNRIEGSHFASPSTTWKSWKERDSCFSKVESTTYKNM